MTEYTPLGRKKEEGIGRMEERKETKERSITYGLLVRPVIIYRPIILIFGDRPRASECEH